MIPFLDGIFLILALSGDEALDDRSIAEAIRNGDEKAFKDLFQKYYPALYRFMVSRGMGHEEAQDLVQKAFMVIWEKRDGIDASKSLRAFLFRIAYNSMLNHVEYRSKFDDSAVPESDSTDTRPTSEVDHAELLDRINRIVEEMPEKRSMVFQLCFMKQFTYKEAAGVMNLNVKTVENHMALAFKDLRRKLADIYGDEFIHYDR